MPIFYVILGHAVQIYGTSTLWTSSQTQLFVRYGDSNIVDALMAASWPPQREAPTRLLPAGRATVGAAMVTRTMEAAGSVVSWMARAMVVVRDKGRRG
jgi:hypothetical protein